MVYIFFEGGGGGVGNRVPMSHSFSKLALVCLYRYILWTPSSLRISLCISLNYNSSWTLRLHFKSLLLCCCLYKSFLITFDVNGSNMVEMTWPLSFGFVGNASCLSGESFSLINLIWTISF